MNKRIKAVRSYYELSQEEFAERIGINRSSLSLLESGKNNPSERTVRMICGQFSVDYHWLVTGQGDMFVTSDDNLLLQLGRKYNLSGKEIRILRKYLNMSPSDRLEFLRFAQALVDSTND